MRGRGAAVPLVGRSAELARLTSALADLDATPSALVLVGDPGVGKSRLLGEFGERARAGGALVLAGACLDVGDTWPYHPLKLALRRPAEDTAPPEDTAPARLLALLDDGGTAEERGVLEQLHWGLCALAAERPVVLVLDDLQWVDSSTRRLVLTLLSGLTRARLLVLGAVRADDARADSPVRGLLQQLRRSRSADLLPLEPLDRDLTLQISRAIAGEELPPESAELVWQRSGGNPFVIEELVRALPATDALPDTLRDMVLTRVGSSPPPAQEVLRAVSVAVGPVAHQVLLRVLAGDVDDVATAVRAAVSSGLLATTADGYLVRHRLVQEALYDDLLPGERQALHARYALALAQVPGRRPHDQLAHHWRRAGDPRRALPAVVAVAEDAHRLGARGEAWSCWQHAVELAEEVEGSTGRQLLLRAAEAAFQADDLSAALALVERAATAGADPSPLDGEATALPLGAVRARYLAASGRLVPAAEAYEEVLASGGPAGAPGADVRADVAARLAELLVRLGRYRAAAEHARTALELTSGRPAAIDSWVLAAAALGFSHVYLDQPEAGRASCAAAVDAAEAAGRPDAVGTAYLHLADLLNGPLNELEEGVAVARQGAARVTELGGRAEPVTRLLASAATGLFRLGRWTEAAEVASEAVDRDPTGAAVVDLLLARARVVMGLGDLDAAERDLHALETLLADGAGSRQALPLTTLQAGQAMWRRDHEAARAAVRRGLEAARDGDDVWLLAPLIWHGLRAEAEAVSDGLPADEEAIRVLTAAEADLVERSGQAAPQITDMVRGYALLDAAERSRASGSPDAAAWRRAAEYWAARGHPYPAAYARLRQAEALLFEHSRNREAAEALALAHRTASRLSARPLAAEIESLAGRARIRLAEPASELPSPRPAAEALPPAPGRAAPDDPLHSLTQREREVLAELATGLSNREIGRRLYISERTAGVHVSRILAKLHARTRVEATAIYLRSRPRAPAPGG